MRLIGRWLASAHRRTVQVQAVGIVNEAVQDGISKGGITGCQCRMPVLDRQLADDQRRADLIAIIDDLEQIFGFDEARRRQ